MTPTLKKIIQIVGVVLLAPALAGFYMPFEKTSVPLNPSIPLQIEMNPKPNN